jgi:hypothetical protein
MVQSFTGSFFLIAGFGGGVLPTLSMLQRSSLLGGFLDAVDKDVTRESCFGLEVQGSVDGRLIAAA